MFPAAVVASESLLRYYGQGCLSTGGGGFAIKLRNSKVVYGVEKKKITNHRHLTIISRAKRFMFAIALHRYFDRFPSSMG